MNKQHSVEYPTPTFHSDEKLIMASAAIDAFRQTHDFSSPDEWFKYINNLCILYPTHHDRGFYVFDLFLSHSDNLHSLRILRNAKETIRPYEYSTVLALRQNHITQKRLVLMPVTHKDSPLDARRAIMIDRELKPSRYPASEVMKQEFDTCLKTYTDVHAIPPRPRH